MFYYFILTCPELCRGSEVEGNQVVNRNQNARKHGFYSKKLTPAQQENLPSAAKVNGLDQEIAVLRVKIASILANDPNNIPLLVMAMSSLAKLIKAKQRLDKDDLQDILEVIQGK